MGAMTDFLENKLIDWLFRAQALGITGASAGAGTGLSHAYVGLLTAAPSDSAAGTEVATGSYARADVVSSLAAWAGTQGATTTAVSSGVSGTTSNNAAITFPAPTADWGSITHFGVYDAATGGHLLMYSALAIPKTVNNGDPAPSFAVSQLTAQLDN